MNSTSKQLEPLAIVGISSLFPAAQSLDEYWANIKEKIDAVREVPESHWNHEEYFDSDKKKPDHVYTVNGGFLDPVDFNPAQWGISPSDLDSIDTSQLLSLIVAHGALADAGYINNPDFDSDNTSVVLGLTGTLELVVPLGARLGHPLWKKAMLHAGIKTEIAERVIGDLKKAYVSWQENSFPGLLGNVAAGRIANRLNLGGTNCVVDAACASTLGAVNHAAMELWTGKANMVITGGVDTFNDIFMYMCFCKTPALSPTGHARPFSEDNDGTILGEGIGMFVLKRLSDAERDNDNIYALINSIGSSSDGKGKAIYAPSAEGQAKAIKRAYSQAGITPNDVTLIEAHGTGTGAGDEIEATALNGIYQNNEARRPWCAIGSVKSQIGHTKAAAGAAGIIKTALALHNKTIPPTAKISKPTKAFRSQNTAFYLPDKIRPWITDNNKKRFACVSSLGFGGSNYHAVLSEYKKNKTKIDWPRGVELITLCSDEHNALTGMLAEFSKITTKKDIKTFAAKSRADFNSQAKHKLCFVIEPSTDIQKLCTELSTKLAENPEAENFTTPSGAEYTNNAKPEPVGVIFPGQGSQYTGMNLDVNCASPVSFQILSESNYSIGSVDEAGNHLVDYIYPTPSYDKSKDTSFEEKLKATDIAQPAIGTVSMGQYKTLQLFGLEVEAFTGHSYGELTSLCAAGAFDEVTLARISRQRGLLMAQGEGDRGGMVAVTATREKAEEILKLEKLDLVVANHNSPKQVVLSGKTEEIQRSKAAFKKYKIRATPLKVAGAFHSSFVASAAEPFFEFLQQQDFEKTTKPVYANTSAAIYPEDPQEARMLLGYQLANQVRFVEIIQKMYEDGIRTFIEVGPGGKLIALAKSTLEGKPAKFLAFDSSAGKRSSMVDLARLLARLAANGYSLDYSLWQNTEQWLESVAAEKKAPLTFKICGANYKSPEQLKHLQKLNLKPEGKQLEDTQVHEVTRADNQPANNPKNDNKKTQPLDDNATTPRQSTEHSVKPHTIENTQNPFASEALSTLQKMQIQTAQLHQKFLEGQETAHKAIMQLINKSSNHPEQILTERIKQPIIQQEHSDESLTNSDKLQVVTNEQKNLTQALKTNITKDQPLTQKPLQAQKETNLATKHDVPDQTDSPQTKEVTTILEVVSEKTGYPLEMIKLDMDMEADLGIDSIKRVEIMSAVQEKLPEAPVVQPDQLGSLKTLQQIIDFLSIHPETSKATQAAKSNNSTQAKNADKASNSQLTQDIIAVVLEIVSEKTGYPPDMIKLDMDMEADLGIDSIKRVEIMSAVQEKLPDAPVVQPDQLGQLKTLAQIADYLQGEQHDTQTSTHKPDLSTDTSSSSQGQDDVKNNQNSSNVKTVLTQIVAEKTGYPESMLQIDMDMEADLGIDSIKRVEIMSAVQEKLPDAPVLKPEQLGKVRTLGQIIDFLSENNETTENVQADISKPSQDKVAEQTTPYSETKHNLETEKKSEIPSNSSLKKSLVNQKSYKPDKSNNNKGSHPIKGGELVRKVVKATPSLDLSENKVLKNNDKVLITSEGGELSEKLCNKLNSLGLASKTMPLDQIIENGVDQELKALIIIAPEPRKTSNGLWEEDSLEHLKNALIATKKASTALKSNKGLIATVSRMDGAFALESPTRTIDPIQGGLAGIAKTARHEWSEVSARAIDVDYRLKDYDLAAEKLAQEIIHEGQIETGITKSSKYIITEESRPIGSQSDSAPLMGENNLILVTGGARGVTAEVAIKIAQKYKYTMVLMGRSNLSQPEPDWLAELESEADIKKAIINNSNGSITPMELMKKYKTIIANREILANMQRICDAGSKALYYSVDIRNAQEVKKQILAIEKDFGNIDGVIHGAGVLRDKKIEEKTREQIDDVIDTKVTGLKNILSVIAVENLKLLIMFSSFSGRHGRAGQVDYSMANEALNKIAQKFKILKPECLTLSLNWGPWAGGMVTPALRELFASEQIGLIRLDDGAIHLINEIGSADNSEIEISVIAKHDEMVKPSANTNKQPQKKLKNKGINLPPTIDKTVKLDKILDLEMDLTTNNWLNDHQLAGTPILPAALSAEILISAALKKYPDLNFIGYENFRVLKGLALQNHDKVVQVYLSKAYQHEHGIALTAELRSNENNKESVNVRSTIILGTENNHYSPEKFEIDTILVYQSSINQIYNEQLFHGKSFQGLLKVEGWSEEGIAAFCKTCPEPQMWFPQLGIKNWNADPLLVDTAYQLMILWTIQNCSAPSLPSFIRSYRQYKPFTNSGYRVAARAHRSGVASATADIDFIDQNGEVKARIEGYECTINEDLTNAFKKRMALGES